MALNIMTRMYIHMYILQLHIKYWVASIITIHLLPRQQWVLHETTSLLGPEQPFPPQGRAGLLHTLVRFCVPPPQLLLHDP